MTHKRIPSSRTIVFEVFSVTIGIILGFIVNEWRENLYKRKKAEVSITRIITEVEANVSLIKMRHPYYKALLDSARSTVGYEEMDLRELGDWQGTNPPLFTESAYNVALSTGTLDYIDTELAAKITEFYASQRSFGNFSRFAVANTLLIDEKASETYYYRTISFYEEYSRIYLLRYDNLKSYLSQME